jgi:hypothetical protein
VTGGPDCHDDLRDDGSSQTTHEEEAMRRIETILENLLALNPVEFRTPVDWWSNGERGHLHTNLHCEKVRKSPVATVVQRKTIADAYQQHRCDLCATELYNLTPEQKELVEAGSRLLSVEVKAEQPITRQFEAFEHYPELITLAVRNHFLDLAEELEKVPDLRGVRPWRRRIGDLLSRLTPDAPADDALQSATLRLAAVTVLSRELERRTADPTLWGGSEVLDFFGEIQHRDWHKDCVNRNSLAWFARECLRQIALGEDLEMFAGRLLANADAVADLLADPAAERLALCEDLEAPRPGENLQTYTKRIWALHAARQFAKAAARWSRLVGEMLEPATPVLVANADLTASSYRPQQEAILIAASNPVKVKHANHVPVALRAHPTVARMISDERAHRSVSQQWSTPIPLDEDVADEVVETALSLWEPYDRYSAYHEFHEAWAAATALT